MNDFLIFSSISINIKGKKYANFNSPGRLKRRSLNSVLDTGQMTANGVNRRKGMFPKEKKEEKAGSALTPYSTISTFRIIILSGRGYPVKALNSRCLSVTR